MGAVYQPPSGWLISCVAPRLKKPLTWPARRLFGLRRQSAAATALFHARIWRRLQPKRRRAARVAVCEDPRSPNRLPPGGARLSQPQRAARPGRFELLTPPPLHQHGARKLRRHPVSPRAAAETAALRQRGSALNQMVCANFPGHPISPSFFAPLLRLCDSAFIPRSCPSSLTHARPRCRLAS